MENRLKERLTGAAILVALIVLVVPELFRGQRDATPVGARGAADGPAVRSYVIDLKDSAAHEAAPVQPAMPPPAAAAAASTPPLAASAPATAPGATPATVGAEPARASAPAALSPAAASPRAMPAGTTGWSVQLGLFAQRENAQRLLQAAQSKGFAVSLSGADANGFYRVHLTGLSDRAAAETVRARLRAQGFAAAIVGP